MDRSTSNAAAALPELPAGAFRKVDPSADGLFYVQPRFVAHLDDAAIAAVTRLYREVLPPGGRVLDLMGSWISHLPDDVRYAEVIGHGMNAQELAANPRYARWFVQDLNQQPALDLPPGSLDAAVCCASIQYQQRPVEVWQGVLRALGPGGLAVVTFSNRCFPTKAVAIWQALDGLDQCRLVELYLARAGFGRVESRTLVSPNSRTDPVWAVLGWSG